MKKTIILLLTALLILVGCGVNNKPLSKEEINTIFTSTDNTLAQDSGSIEMRFVVDGQIKPNPMFSQEESSVKPFEDLNLDLLAKVQIISSPEVQMFVQTEGTSTSDVDDELLGTHYYFIKQEGNQIINYEYDNDSKSWLEKEKSPLPNEFKFDQSLKMNHDLVQNIIKDAQEYTVSESVVMIDNKPTTEILIPIGQSLFNGIAEEASKTSPEAAGMIGPMLSMLGNDFLKVRLYIANDTKDIKRLRVDVNTETPLFSMIGLEATDFYVEMNYKESSLTEINSAVGLPQ